MATVSKQMADEIMIHREQWERLRPACESGIRTVENEVDEKLKCIMVVLVDENDTVVMVTRTSVRLVTQKLELKDIKFLLDIL